MQFDSRRVHGVEAAREHPRERIVERKRTAILNDNALECTQGLARGKTQIPPDLVVKSQAIDIA